MSVVPGGGLKWLVVDRCRIVGGKLQENTQKWGQKRGPKMCFRGRQVGAFSVFWQRDTGIPFIFSCFLTFFRFFCRFRG